MDILQKIFSVKNSDDKKHKIITIAGITFKIKWFFTVELNEEEMENLIGQIDKTKQNYLYLDWYFGKYVFDTMLEANYLHVNLIKFSLFDLFGFANRVVFWRKWKYSRVYIRKTLVNSLKNKNIKGLLVTSDWAAHFDELIDIFKEMNVPTYCIIHEGVFQNEDIYYDSQKPLSDKVLTWGELTKQIFVKRGYPEKLSLFEQIAYIKGARVLPEYMAQQHI